MFPNKEEVSSTTVQGAVGSVGYSLLLGTALHSGIAGSFCLSAVPCTKWVLPDRCARIVPPTPLATPSPDKRLDDRCNRGMGGQRKEEHNHQRMNQMARPRCGIGAAGSGARTGGAVEGRGGTTVTRSVGVAYYWSDALILDAKLALCLESVSTALKHLAMLLLDIFR